ncbi:MAG: hypothetical protein AB1589_30460 [Cyanobacteriota bacterium]
MIDDYRRDPNYYKKIRALMMVHFREDWERIALGGYNKNPQEMLFYRRSLPREGLDGTYLESFGEKVIADFLFEHNINTPERLAKVIDSHGCASDVERRFLELAQTFYKSYLERLQATGKDDFDGLIDAKSCRNHCIRTNRISP